jgi:hypothetical protein
MPLLGTKQDARERRSIIHARASALGLGPLPRQERFYESPQFVGKQWFRHKRIVLHGRVF